MTEGQQLISIETDRALREASRQYIGELRLPQYSNILGDFWCVYEPRLLPVSAELKTMISGYAAYLVLSAYGGDRIPAIAAAVELKPDAPAMISPLLVAERGGEAAHHRPRVLTNREGQALVSDLKTLLAIHKDS